MIINFSIATLFCVFLSSLPIISIIFLKKNKSKLGDPAFKSKYESLYLGINNDADTAIAYIVMFMVRRVIYALSMILVTSPNL